MKMETAIYILLIICLINTVINVFLLRRYYKMNNIFIIFKDYVTKSIDGLYGKASYIIQDVEELRKNLIIARTDIDKLRTIRTNIAIETEETLTKIIADIDELKIAISCIDILPKSECEWKVLSRTDEFDVIPVTVTLELPPERYSDSEVTTERIQAHLLSELEKKLRPFIIFENDFDITTGYKKYKATIKILKGDDTHGYAD